MSKKDVNLSWQTTKENEAGAAITTTVNFYGSLDSFCELCTRLSGFATSAFIKSVENIALQAVGDNGEETK